jgi:hypothetical protein
MASFTQLKVSLIPIFCAAFFIATAQPSVQWRFKIKQPIFSSPIASDGVAFFGGLDSTVYALDIQTGAQKWKLRTNGEIRSNLVLHNNQLFLAGGNGVLSCIDKNSGKPVWRVIFDNNSLYLAERRYDFADYYHSSPLIRDNIIYLGSGSGLMQAFKSENGELLWSFKAGDIIHSTAVIVKEKLCFGSYDGHVYALNLRDGSLAWKFKSAGQEYFPKGEFNSSPAANNNTIFIGSRDYNTYALNVNGGIQIGTRCSSHGRLRIPFAIPWCTLAHPTTGCCWHSMRATAGRYGRRMSSSTSSVIAQLRLHRSMSVLSGAACWLSIQKPVPSNGLSKRTDTKATTTGISGKTIHSGTTSVQYSGRRWNGSQPSIKWEGCGLRRWLSATGSS